MLKNISPEIKLIILSAQVFFGEIVPEKLKEFIKNQQKNFNWEKFLEIARKQKLEGLLYRVFSDFSFEKMFSEETLNQLKNDYLKIYVASLKKTAEFFLIKKICDQHNIEIVPQKGFVFGEIVYKDIGTRCSGVDLDLLILPENKIIVFELLKKSGYSLYAENFGHSANFKKGLMTIDLQWDLLPPGLSKIPFKKIWERLQTITIDGKNLKTLSPEDMLISMALQIRHDWPSFSLMRIFDIYGLISVFKNNFDWQYLKNFAHTSELTSTISFALKTCEKIFDLNFGKKVFSFKADFLSYLFCSYFNYFLSFKSVINKTTFFSKPLKLLMVDNYLQYFLFQLKQKLNL